MTILNIDIASHTFLINLQISSVQYIEILYNKYVRIPHEQRITEKQCLSSWSPYNVKSAVKYKY